MHNKWQKYKIGRRKRRKKKGKKYIYKIGRREKKKRVMHMCQVEIWEKRRRKLRKKCTDVYMCEVEI